MTLHYYDIHTDLSSLYLLTSKIRLSIVSKRKKFEKSEMLYILV